MIPIAAGQPLFRPLTLALIFQTGLYPRSYSEPAKTRLQRMLSEITQVIIPHGHIVLCYRAILAV
jgi:hypothetical protein